MCSHLVICAYTSPFHIFLCVSQFEDLGVLRAHFLNVIQKHKVKEDARLRSVLKREYLLMYSLSIPLAPPHISPSCPHSLLPSLPPALTPSCPHSLPQYPVHTDLIFITLLLD